MMVHYNIAADVSLFRTTTETNIYTQLEESTITMVVLIIEMNESIFSI